MGASSTIIKIAILGEARGIREAVKKSNESLEHLSKKATTTGQKVTAGANKVVGALSAGAAAIVGVSIKNGDELNESEEQLQGALDNSKQHIRDLAGSVGPLQRQMEKYGYTNAEVDDSLTILTRSHIKLKDAVKDEAIASDLAKAKHISLADATTIVAKASEGNLKPLKALAIDLPIAAGGALKLAAAQTAVKASAAAVYVAMGGVNKAHEIAARLLADAEHRHLKGAKAAAVYAKANAIIERAEGKLSKAQDKLKASQEKVTKAQGAGRKILGELASRIKGTAERSTNSLAGKTAALKAKFTDMTAHLGQKLIPIVLTLGTKFGELVEFFSKNKAALVALTAAVSVFVAACVTLFIIDKIKKMQEAWTKVQAALNIEMGLCPALLVAAAIATLVAGIIYAYRNFKWFHQAVDAAWQGLQTGFHWVQRNWPLLLAILTGPFGLVALYVYRKRDEIIGFIKDIPGKIAGFAAGMWNGITHAFGVAKDWIGGKIDDILGWFSGLPGRISRRVVGLFDGLKGAFTTAVNWLIEKWNWLADKLSIHKSILGYHIDVDLLPHLNKMHTGIAAGAYQAPFGQSEGVAVLKTGERVLTPEQMRAHYASGGGGGGDTIINLPTGADPRATVRAQKRYDRANGRR